MSTASSSEPDAKRRRLRKGTTSCWECKRRKVRCDFDNDPSCLQCRRRGTSCNSQEYPEDRSLLDTPVPTIEDRLISIEQRLNGAVDIAATSTTLSSSTPASYGSSAAAFTNAGGLQSPESVTTSKITTKRPDVLTDTITDLSTHDLLSEILHGVIPSFRDLDLICEAGSRIAVYTLQHLRFSEGEVGHEGFDKVKQELLRRPPPDAHPVVLGRYVFSVATFLQYIPSDAPHAVNGLSQCPKAMMKQLVETTSRFVTSNDQLLTTVEGLECLILEGTLLANAGSVRRAWLAFQRAISLAQLMGLHRTQTHQPLCFANPTNARLNRQVVWFRLLYIDRFLSLMLGLQPNSLDCSFASKTALAGLAPFERMQRRHAVVALHIAQLWDTDLDDVHHRKTREVDVCLQEVANGLPEHWWLTPNLRDTPNANMLEETLRLVHQMYHFNLINQLHLPYLLQSSAAVDEESRHLMSYSKLTCMNACRDILNRFVALRSFNSLTLCCRAVDYFASMAAVTLLLAHLDSHNSSTKDKLQGQLLGHQRHNDRAMIILAAENMERLSNSNDDSLGKEGAKCLRQLIAIEGDAATGKPLRRMMESDAQREDERLISRIWIPYFGLIRITCSINAEDVPDGQKPSTAQSTASGSPAQLLPQGRQQGVYQQGLSQTLPLEAPFTDFTASVDDWMFQGVDLAFFDSLIAQEDLASVTQGGSSRQQ